MHFCLIRETKDPPDKRVPIAPHQYAVLKKRYPEHNFTIESSPIRCFSDEEYTAEGIEIIESPEMADILLGVKEVKKNKLIDGKTYFFFSHTAKKQSYNQDLLQIAAQKKITLIDYEYLVRDKQRVVAFGYWAGIVGAYNGLRGFGLKTKQYKLKSAHECKDLIELKQELKKVSFKSPVSIVVTGEGRVSGGACEILESAGISKISPEKYLTQHVGENHYCQLGPQHYTKHNSGKPFDFLYFIDHPIEYESNFNPYLSKTDLIISAHFWDPKAPVLFTLEDTRKSEFRIRMIADITCDIQGSIPTTLRASTIAHPFYGFNRNDYNETDAFQENVINVMAVDNLPGELPRDASTSFGEKLSEIVLPELIKSNNSELIVGATILKNGFLGQSFIYLNDFLEGN